MIPRQAPFRCLLLFCGVLPPHSLFHTSEGYEVVLLEHTLNQIALRGSLVSLPEFSHENHGKRFFRFFLDVPRSSGTVDRLPVVAGEDVLNTLDPTGGEMITVNGQIRSHNIRTEGTRHLLIFVFASSILAEDGDPINSCTLEGHLCKDPTYRRTPLGREICDMMLAVPRAFRRADYLPCILWGRTARDVAACHVRDQVTVCGRLQSRLYTKQTENGPEERTAYEVSALTAQIHTAEE